MQNHTQTYKDIVFHMFDPVTIQLSLDRSNIQHEKLVFKLVKPYIPDFSVPSLGKKDEKMEVDTLENDAETSNKRKEDTEEQPVKGKKKKRRR